MNPPPAPGRVRLIEPFGAGGGPDIVARAIAAPLSEGWGRAVYVENHPGGGSTAAPALVRRAPADGDTLLVNTSAHAYRAAIVEGLTYDPSRDFVAVVPLTSQAYVLVANSRTGVASVSELVAVTRSAPRAMTFGSTGLGTGTHIGTVQLNLTIGISALHMPPAPTESISDVATSVARGTVDYAMLPISIAAPHIATGNVAALGVTTARRSPVLPDVPTLGEAAGADYDFPIWYGVWAPAGTPSGTVDLIARDITAVLARPDVHGGLVDHGMEPITMSPEMFARFVLDETRRAAQILAAYDDATAR